METSSSQETALEATIHDYATTMYVQYLVVGGYAAVVSDYLHTLPDELRFIWPSPLSIPKVLFFSLRYYILAHGPLVIYQMISRGHSPEVCKAGFVRITVSSLVVVNISEAIMFIRVYAFSGQNKKLLPVLLFLFVSIHGSGLYLTIRFLGTVEYAKLAIPNIVCMPAAANSTFLAGVYATFLVSATAVLIIMVFVAYLKHWGLRSGLFKIFYRDGIFYFVCLSALAAANMLSLLGLADAGFKYLLGQVQIDLHTVLSTRMILHLRAYAHMDVDSGEGTAQPSNIEVSMLRESTGSNSDGTPGSRIPLGIIQFRHPQPSVDEGLDYR